MVFSIPPYILHFSFYSEAVTGTEIIKWQSWTFFQLVSINLLVDSLKVQNLRYYFSLFTFFFPLFFSAYNRVCRCFNGFLYFFFFLDVPNFFFLNKCKGVQAVKFPECLKLLLTCSIPQTRTCLQVLQFKFNLGRRPRTSNLCPNLVSDPMLNTARWKVIF